MCARSTSTPKISPSHTAAHADETVSLPDGVLGVDQRRAAFERDPDERPNLPLARHRPRRRRQQHGRQHDAPA